MASVATSPGPLRRASAAARFRPCIRLRATEWPAFRSRDIAIVVRYGVMPDGSEVSLGRTVNRNLDEAIGQYWARLFLFGLYRWIPRPARALAFRVFRKWRDVKIEGYEMTPLEPLEKE